MPIATSRNVASTRNLTREPGRHALPTSDEIASVTTALITNDFSLDPGIAHLVIAEKYPDPVVKSGPDSRMEEAATIKTLNAKGVVETRTLWRLYGVGDYAITTPEIARTTLAR